MKPIYSNIYGLVVWNLKWLISTIWLRAYSFACAVLSETISLSYFSGMAKYPSFRVKNKWEGIFLCCVGKFSGKILFFYISRFYFTIKFLVPSWLLLYSWRGPSGLALITIAIFSPLIGFHFALSRISKDEYCVDCRKWNWQ